MTDPALDTPGRRLGEFLDATIEELGAKNAPAPQPVPLVERGLAADEPLTAELLEARLDGVNLSANPAPATVVPPPVSPILTADPQPAPAPASQPVKPKPAARAPINIFAQIPQRLAAAQ